MKENRRYNSKVTPKYKFSNLEGNKSILFFDLPMFASDGLFFWKGIGYYLERVVF